MGALMSEVYEISDRYVERLAALDPCTATGAGIPGHDREMTDFSPAGLAERLQFTRDTIAALDAAAQEDLRSLRIIGSPVQEIRQVFDLMAFDTDDDWDVARERMTRVPDAVAGYEATLREGMARGVVS